MMRTKGLMVVAAVLLPLLWTGTLWASQEPIVPNENAINQGNIGIGGGIEPAAETAITTRSAVTGTVVGANCWLAQGLQGDKYRDSAIACARNGTPLVILTDAGSLVYPLAIATNGNAMPEMDRLMSFAGQRVTVTGQLVSRGRERAIVVDQVAKTPGPAKMPTIAFKQTPNAEVDGRVVDVGCWFQKGNVGMTDASCVRDCEASGDPLAIVTSAGRMYYPVSMTMPTTPVGDAVLSNYCAQKVRVMGTTVERGDGRAIIIDKVVPYAVK